MQGTREWLHSYGEVFVLTIHAAYSAESSESFDSLSHLAQRPVLVLFSKFWPQPSPESEEQNETSGVDMMGEDRVTG